MAAFAVRVTVTSGVIRNGSINQIIAIVVHVDIVYTRHLVDDIQSALKGSTVIFKHGAIQGTFHQKAYVIPVLADD
jgi:hypothetical protein